MQRVLLSLAVATVLAGCGDPLRDVPKLQDVEVNPAAGQADALADPVDAAIADVIGEARPEPVAEDKPRGGLLGFLGRRAEKAKETAPVEAELDVASEEPVLEAEVTADVPEGAPEAEEPVQVAALVAPVEPETPKKRRGLFGLGGGSSSDGTPKKRKSANAPKPGDPDYQQVAMGTTLPYGEIARVCNAPRSQLGSKVDQWPDKGRGYTLYDSAPGGTGQRSFYLTGFDDGCARVFTAALVLFASPETYEAIHYGTARKAVSTSNTDDAYERVKSRICRVGKGKPCGSKMSKLAKTTVFVTVYERFGGSPRWKNFLLHDGQLEAMDIKS